MRVARFKRNNRIAYGVVTGDTIEEISSTPFLPYERTGEVYKREEVRLLAPSILSKVVGIVLNLADHVS